ncbi:hypothetical protein SNE40_002774 [Patella caerulea]|uniref:RING finger protein 141 n=1 Tax=Patella caerulea TaxID=87958 RepID=A0AAN8KCW5_PATCE
MGQGPSFSDPAHHVGRLQANIEIMHQLANLNHEDFKNSIKELNAITQSFTDHRGKQLHFSIKKRTDDSIWWKGLARVRCVKLNSMTKRVESSRLLNLKQYITMYKEITDQVSSLSCTQPTLESNDITASCIFEGVKDGEITNADVECCICMERKSEIILPCSHEFCETCIDSWNVSHNTCPLCRSKVESTDDTWVLTEKPSRADYDSEVKGYLVGLADRTGST